MGTYRMERFGHYEQCQTWPLNPLDWFDQIATAASIGTFLFYYGNQKYPCACNRKTIYQFLPNCLTDWDWLCSVAVRLVVGNEMLELHEYPIWLPWVAILKKNTLTYLLCWFGLNFISNINGMCGKSWWIFWILDCHFWVLWQPQGYVHV